MELSVGGEAESRPIPDKSSSYSPDMQINRFGIRLCVDYFGLSAACFLPFLRSAVPELLLPGTPFPYCVPISSRAGVFIAPECIDALHASLRCLFACALSPPSPDMHRRPHGEGAAVGSWQLAETRRRGEEPGPRGCGCGQRHPPAMEVMTRSRTLPARFNAGRADCPFRRHRPSR